MAGEGHIIGYKSNKGVAVFFDGKFLSPHSSQTVWNHSPDGFNWGYGGSGPAQLALGILLEVIDRRTAIRLHQDFKWEFICSLPTDFKLKINDVRAWVSDKLLEIAEDLKGVAV